MSGSFPGRCPGIASGQMDGAGETGRNLPEAAPGSLGLNAFNLRTARHLGGAHDDADQISSRAAWWDAPRPVVAVGGKGRRDAAGAGVWLPGGRARSRCAGSAGLAGRGGSRLPRGARLACQLNLRSHFWHMPGELFCGLELN